MHTHYTKTYIRAHTEVRSQKSQHLSAKMQKLHLNFNFTKPLRVGVTNQCKLQTKMLAGTSDGAAHHPRPIIPDRWKPYR